MLQLYFTVPDLNTYLLITFTEWHLKKFSISSLHLKFLAHLILTVLSPECNWSWQDGLFTAHPVFGRFIYVENVGYVANVSPQDLTAYISRVYSYHNIWQTELIVEFRLHTNLQLLIALSSVQRVYIYWPLFAKL